MTLLDLKSTLRTPFVPAALVLAAALLLPAAVPGSTNPAAGTATESIEAAPAPERSARAPFRDRVTHEGIEVDVTIEPLADVGELREGDYARVRLEIQDGNTGKALSAVYPAAWLDLLPPGGDADEDPCGSKVEAFLGGSILNQAEVDLNVFYVLALNEEASVSVVDPLFGFGGSKLLAMMPLKSPGVDWALTEDQQRLFIALPEVDEVAVAETLGWEVVTYAPVGPGPQRLALQPDNAFLWVAFDGENEAGERESGVSVVGTTALKELARIPTGAGAHDLVFSSDNRFVYVANADAGTVSVIDVATQQKVADVATGSRPTSMAWSTAGRALYVTDVVDGTVTVIDGDRHQVVTRMETEPGVGRIRFAPDGRFGLALVPTSDDVYVVDAALNRVVQHGQVEEGPDQVAFSDELAYVRHRGSEIMLMIPLDSIGDEGRPIQVIDFPGGSAPPAGGVPVPADGMAQAPGAPAMLIANRNDGNIYFYKEGMAAPMGHFKNYGRHPRAVKVVDRSLQETGPGVYETGIRLRRPGDYDLAFFLDTPRIVHCFPLQVAADPEMEDRRRPEMMVRALTEPGTVLTVGEPQELRFKVYDPATDQPLSGLDDFQVLTVLAPGIWHKRHIAEEEGEGVYVWRFTPERSGVYYVYTGSEQKGAGFNENPYQAYQAVEADDPAEGGDAAPASDVAEGE